MTEQTGNNIGGVGSSRAGVARGRYDGESRPKPGDFGEVLLEARQPIVDMSLREYMSFRQSGPMPDAWLNAQPPCESAGEPCSSGASWRARLECGHWGLLCDVHQRRAAGLPHINNRYWRWFCDHCGQMTASIAWSRL